MIEYFNVVLNARRSHPDDRGASAMEYGLLIAGIAAVVVVVAILLSGGTQEAFQGACDASTSAPDTCAPLAGVSGN